MSASFLTFLDRASSMIELGIPIVPLPPCKKFPPPKGWQNIATTDIEIIKGWLIANGGPAIAFEDSNCACVAMPDGFCFFEIDKMKVVSEQIQKDTGHKLQEIMTLVVRSSGEKRHLYFKQNDASRALGNVDYDGPDGAELFSFRANGKYVVSPFSLHPDTGTEYEITRNADIIEAPVWLTDWLRTAKRTNGVRKRQLAADETAKIYEGGRDDFMFNEACKCRDTKMSQKAALAALMVTDQDRCIPPLGEAVLEIKITSAYKRDAREKQNAETFVESGASPTGVGPSQVEERPDMPRTVLSGRLGEICEHEMLDDFPVSYAWLSLITAASVLVPERPPTGNGDNLHNLYTALVGPVNCGKSQAIEWALQLLRIQEDLKRYDEVKPGSAERLLKYMNRRKADGDLSPRVLMSLDEWKFFFDKAAIENSVFPTLLTTGFYKRNATILDSFGRPLTVPASFSWIGGIVTDSYDDCLSQVTSLGLHDRLLQGINPSNYRGFNYRPFEGKRLPADFEPQPVQIDKSVWECLKSWRGANPQATREAELAFRVAEICASFDGAPVLYGKDMEPHLILADEQMKLRKILKPNIGETPDAQCAIKVENYLTAYGSTGEWVDFRAMMKAIHYERFGPNIFKRTIDGLVYLKVVEIGERPSAGKHAGGHPTKAIRRVLG